MSARTGSERGRKRQEGCREKDQHNYKKAAYLVECKKFGRWEQPEGEKSRRTVREWKERDFLCLACRIQSLEEVLRNSQTRQGEIGATIVNHPTQTEAKEHRGVARGEASIAKGAELAVHLLQREKLLAVTHKRTVVVEGRRFKSLAQYILYERVRASGRDRQVAVRYLSNL